MSALKNIFIAMVLPVAIGFSSQAIAQLPEPVTKALVTVPHIKNKIANALDVFLKRHPESKYLVLGEDHKSRIRNYDFLSDPGIISVFKSHGMHTLAIESPAGFQDYLNKVMSNNLNPENYAAAIVQEYINIGEKEENLQDVRESYKAQGSLTQSQVKFGNKVILFDNPGMALADRNRQIAIANKNYKAAVRIANQKSEKDMPNAAEALKNSGMGLSEENKARASGWIAGKTLAEDPAAREGRGILLKLRVNESDEKLRANHIRENAIGGAVVLVGRAHGSTECDLDEQLQALRLIIVPDMERFYTESQAHFNTGEELSEGYLVLDEGRIISGEEAFMAAKKFDADMEKAMKGTNDPAQKNPASQSYNGSYGI